MQRWGLPTTRQVLIKLVTINDILHGLWKMVEGGAVMLSAKNLIIN